MNIAGVVWLSIVYIAWAALSAVPAFVLARVVPASHPWLRYIAAIVVFTLFVTPSLGSATIAVVSVPFAFIFLSALIALDMSGVTWTLQQWPLWHSIAFPVTFLVALVVFRRLRPNNSFKPTPLRGVGKASYDRGVAAAANRRGLIQALGTPMLVLGFAIFGLIGIVFAVVAIRANKKLAASGAASRDWLLARRLSGPIGLVLGVASYFIWYNIHDNGQTWRVMGFPFFAAAFDSRGSDYVGITTIPAVIGNFLFFAALPQLILWVTGRRFSRRAA